MKQVRKTQRYECVGGPRDGDIVLVRRGVSEVTLDGHKYRVRLWARLDGIQRTLFERERLVWEGIP